MNLITHTSVSMPLSLQANATTTRTGSYVDTTGFQSITFLANLTTTGAGSFTLSANQSNLGGTNTGTAIPGASTTAISGTSGATAGAGLLLEIVAPQQRYVQPVFTTDGTMTAAVEIFALLQPGMKQPPAQGAYILATLVIAPTA